MFPWASPGRLAAHASDFLISIVIPVYNHARFLSQAVQSVLQAAVIYPIEIIVVDDGSTDEIEPVLNEIDSLKKNNLRKIKIIRQKNAGLSNALNRGFLEAEGVFLSWTSADNLYLPGAIDILANFLFSNPSVGLTYGNVRLIDDGGNTLSESSYRKAEQTGPEKGFLYLPYAASTLSDYNDNFINACFLYRRAFAEFAGSYRQENNGFEDYDFWLRGSLGFRLAHVDSEAPLYCYRLHDQTLTNELKSSEIRKRQTPLFNKIKQLKTKLSQAGPSIAGSILRRARDSNHLAVEPEENSDLSLVVFLEERVDSDYLLTLLLNYSRFTWVLVCENKQARARADEVNSRLNNNKNLRIVDLTKESQNPEEHQLSLMYVLSSIDLIFAPISCANIEPEFVNKLASYAGLAGRALVLAVNDRDESFELPRKLRFVLEIPHLSLIKLSTLPPYDALFGRIKSACLAMQLGSVEQWLDENSDSVIARRETAKKLLKKV